MQPHKIVPSCPACGKPWTECQGTCLMPSPYADSPILSEISQWAEEYTNRLETELTEKACLCQWIYRNQPTEAEITSAQEASEDKKEYISGPVRSLRVRSHEHPECPVHTRRGFLIGFYQWMVQTKDHSLMPVVSDDTVESVPLPTSESLLLPTKLIHDSHGTYDDCADPARCNTRGHD